jgi:hypothetical protein
LYEDLPESINNLCDLIKKQLIHPFDLDKFGDSIPDDRKYEDMNYPTVQEMLKELINRNNEGLVATRKPGERLVVACVHHNMLLASILRQRGIPVRIRAGYANYILKERKVKVSHVVCEVWNAEKNSWILVDPDRNRVDFPGDEFEFAHEAWNYLTSNRIDKLKYISRSQNIDQGILHLLCHDLYYILGSEELYWNDPPIVLKVENNISDLTEDELNIINRLAAYLENPDIHYKEMLKLYKENLNLHVSKEL